jgi:NADPH2:quinone reductase
MLTYRCSAFGAPETLERVEMDTPAPVAGEAVVAVAAAGVGFVDGLLIQGRYQVKPPLPYFPGSEFSGRVTDVGAGVSDLQTGDRVLGLAPAGAFADFVRIPAAGLVRVPDGLDDNTAAGFYINYATALYGLRDCGRLQPGETLLILGAAGGVGSAAIAVAKTLGAHVIAAASSEAKRQAALASGADQVLDYSQPDWRDALKAATAASGLQLVYDPVGGATAEPALRSLSPGGRFLVVGFASGDIPRIGLNLALLKRCAIVGVDWGGEARANPGINAALMGTLLDWIKAGRLKPAAVVVRPMAELPAALNDQLAGRIVGKLVVSNRPGG